MVDGKWNTVHPGRYFIYRPGSRPPQPSDRFRVARISQILSQSGSPLSLLPWPRLSDPPSPTNHLAARRTKSPSPGTSSSSASRRRKATRGARVHELGAPLFRRHRELQQAAPMRGQGAPRRPHAPTPAASPCSFPPSHVHAAASAGPRCRRRRHPRRAQPGSGDRCAPRSGLCLRTHRLETSPPTSCISFASCCASVPAG